MARTQKRWMKSVIKTSKSEMPALPWARQSRQARGSKPEGATQPAATNARQAS